MSLDGQPVQIHPSAVDNVDPSLPATRLNGTNSKPTINSSPISEQLQLTMLNYTTSNRTHLTSQIGRWGLRDAGLNYNKVAVFGSQFTGKSTLLNRLFGTTFDVMDETRRQQTTKGIWVCRGKDMGVMVMDVEGTDGRERGEDQDFERKSAFFSLASSEVGLYAGVNTGLQRPYLSSQGRTLLLFINRDHDRQLSDCFDLAFTALPHKILATDKFEAEVQELRKRFVNKTRDDFVFKPAYHKRIPADGVAFYMENIWEQVQTNKDLDLPTQQELLAQFRCDEVSSVVLADFTEQSKSQRRPIEAGHAVVGLGDLMRNWRSQALSRYDRDASRYHQGVYQRKRADLLGVMDSTLSPLFLRQLKNLHKSYLSAFKKELLEGLRDDAKEVLLEDTDWTWQDELESLREEIGNVADQCRKDETKKMVNLIERNFKKQISEPVDISLNRATPEMWDKVLSTFKETLEKAESTYLAKARSFNCTDDENVTAKIDEQTADTVILGKLRAHFEERFRYDENAAPRTMDLIPRYANIAPADPSFEFVLPSESSDPLNSTDEFDFPSTLVIFTETKFLDLTARFRKDADAYCVEAKRSTVSSIAQIPYWMHGVLVVHGWNEAMVVLFNPLYVTFTLMTLLMTLLTSYIIVKRGLTGPLFQVSETVLAEPILAQPVRASSVGDYSEDSDQEMRRLRSEPM
ncbi:root hair defective 3 GTP-binding protein-domain-containing protein [Suillus lakei]|nr:root hair defective 3 GTP-binding protein-domain-containing protein [Suillus lakei]